jgi:hypothetical protein
LCQLGLGLADAWNPQIEKLHQDKQEAVEKHVQMARDCPSQAASIMGDLGKQLSAMWSKFIKKQNESPRTNGLVIQMVRAGARAKLSDLQNMIQFLGFQVAPGKKGLRPF